MLIRFWGVRGSLPTPITPQQIQSKIMAAIQRITPDDIVNEDARAKFISSLPSWIFGTTGGNTPCVQVQVDDTELIFDAGPGIRVLGKSQFLPKDNHYNLFFSHFQKSQTQHHKAHFQNELEHRNFEFSIPLANTTTSL